MPEHRLMRREADVQLIALHRVGKTLGIAVNRRFAFGCNFKAESDTNSAEQSGDWTKTAAPPAQA